MTGLPRQLHRGAGFSRDTGAESPVSDVMHRPIIIFLLGALKAKRPILHIINQLLQILLTKEEEELICVKLQKITEDSSLFIFQEWRQWELYR